MTEPRPATFLTPSRLFLVGSLVVLGVVLAVVGPRLLSGRPAAGEGQATGPAVGLLAPDFELTDALSGGQVKLSSFRGRPVWLNFWASWCPGCVREMPRIQQAYERYGQDGLVVLGINVQESPEQARKFATDNAFKWTFLLDRDGRVTDLYYVNGLPFQVFIGPDGVIKAIRPGEVLDSDIEGYLQTILQK
jgi:cytochrome c biogenesis protein CcmG, thiol:disulfide interchange protein DsbE